MTDHDSEELELMASQYRYDQTLPQAADDDDIGEPYDPRERHGHGVCRRPWSCIEPCGPTGGCVA